MGGFRNWCIYGCWDAPLKMGEGLLIKRTFFEDTAKVRLYFFLPKLFEGNFASPPDGQAPNSTVTHYGTTHCNEKTIALKIRTDKKHSARMGPNPSHAS